MFNFQIHNNHIIQES